MAIPSILKDEKKSSNVSIQSIYIIKDYGDGSRNGISR